jgi:hypothetical protein
VREGRQLHGSVWDGARQLRWRLPVALTQQLHRLNRAEYNNTIRDLLSVVYQYRRHQLGGVKAARTVRSRLRRGLFRTAYVIELTIFTALLPALTTNWKLVKSMLSIDVAFSRSRCTSP